MHFSTSIKVKLGLVLYATPKNSPFNLCKFFLSDMNAKTTSLHELEHKDNSKSLLRIVTTYRIQYYYVDNICY